MTLKLSHKGYVLVILPLLIQLSILTILLVALNQAEGELKRVEYAKGLNYHFTMLTGSLVKLIADAHLKGDESLNLEQFRLARSKIETELTALRNLSKQDKTVTLNVDEVAKIIDRSFLYFDEARRATEINDTASTIHNLVNLRALGRRIQRKLDSITEEYRLLEENNPEIHTRERDRLRAFLITAMCINVGMSLLLVAIFNRGTARRHGVLVDNATRFSSGRELLAPLSGADEIARIDKVFHDMAESIEESARQRREFTAMIAHDLRSPLTSLRLTVEMHLRNYKDTLPEKGIRDLNRIEMILDRLVNLINDLLDVEKLESGQMDVHPEMVPVAHILENSLSAVRAQAESKNISITMPESEDHLVVDGNRMIQVLVNILSNAIKFSPVNGEIIVKAEASTDTYEISVTDHGPGIPGSMVEAIFDRFKQVDSTVSGTGLGLAICKEIVELHNGRIFVESSEGKGSKFVIRLPIVGE